MTTLTISRTKRPRDAYKLARHATAAVAATTVSLKAVEHGQNGDLWFVRFKHLPGFKRSAIDKIPPFWDTDVGAALMRWNKDNGGEPSIGCYGSRFVAANREDALMMYLAFA